MVEGLTNKPMYSQLIATLALIESYGLSRSVEDRDRAERALGYCLRSQNPGKGWRYTAQCGENDSSVTAWGAQVLAAARATGIRVPEGAILGVIQWYDEVTEGASCRAGYIDRRIGKVVIPGVNEVYADHPSLTAAGVAARILLKKGRSDNAVHGGVEQVVADLPEWDRRSVKVDLYFWYMASLAIFQFDGPNGPYWSKWNAFFRKALLPHQNQDPTKCRCGSWEPVDRWSSEGGRIYVTSMAVLALRAAQRSALAR
jgi:hypothetical protein